MDLSEDHSTDTTTTQRGNQRERGLYLRVPTQKQKTQRGYEMERDMDPSVLCQLLNTERARDREKYETQETQRGYEMERSMDPSVWCQSTQRHKRHREGTRWREAWIPDCQHRCPTRNMHGHTTWNPHGPQTPRKAKDACTNFAGV